MADDPTECPSCGAAVAFDELTRLGECPECERPLGELFAVAAGRTR